MRRVSAALIALLVLATIAVKNGAAQASTENAAALKQAEASITPERLLKHIQ
jgi:hypothetical protein